MNKNECKKYAKRALNNLLIQNKTPSLENLEMEMKKEIAKQTTIYIAYAKVALHNLKRSASEITDIILDEAIEAVVKIYKESEIKLKAEKL